MAALVKSEDINKKVLQLIGDYDALIVLVEGNIRNKALKNKILFRALNLIVNENPVKALELILRIKEDYNDKSFLTLLIRVYCLNDMISEAFEIYNGIYDSKKKKRFILPIFTAVSAKNKSVGFNILVHQMYPKYKLVESDFQIIYEPGMEFRGILQMMSENEIVITDPSFWIGNYECKQVEIVDGYCSYSKCKLDKISLSDDQIGGLLDNIKGTYLKGGDMKEIEAMDQQIKSGNYNIFIDGGNVLFYKDRKVVIDSFRRLETIYNKAKQLGRPLIVLHRRHKDFLKKNFKKKSKDVKAILARMMPDIFYTPNKMNDDWFFIWAGISNRNTYVVSNDRFRDHIFKISEEDVASDSLTRWIEGSIIRYDFVDSEYNLHMPLSYSVRIQKNGEFWHLPLTDSNWLCLKV